MHVLEEDVKVVVLAWSCWQQLGELRLAKSRLRQGLGNLRAAPSPVASGLLKFPLVPVFFIYFF